jgi:hypothetical protein
MEGAIGIEMPPNWVGVESSKDNAKQSFGDDLQPCE